MRHELRLLLDLDGTLVDTAPDLVGALHAACDTFGVPRLDDDAARREVANGGMGMIQRAFRDHTEVQHQHAHAWFLDYYARHIADQSQVFPALRHVIRTQPQPWGIVTNKPEYLTHLLLDALSLKDQVGCIIAGDTLPVRKPDPAPLLMAAEQLGAAPEQFLYAGDHLRDVQAAKAAGMYAIGVGYGYNLVGDSPDAWDADRVCTTPESLAELIAEKTGAKQHDA
ncbi:MAG: HAD-IA family hydrolase [Pseudomonadota bacterium]